MGVREGMGVCESTDRGGDREFSEDLTAEDLDRTPADTETPADTAVAAPAHKYAEDVLEKEAAEIFSAADNDNNEVLSHTELKKYIQAHDEIKKRLLKIGSGEECGWSGLFQDADADGDGEITLEEFKEFFKRKALMYKEVEEAEAAEAAQAEAAKAEQ